MCPGCFGPHCDGSSGTLWGGGSEAGQRRETGSWSHALGAVPMAGGGRQDGGPEGTWGPVMSLAEARRAQVWCEGSQRLPQGRSPVTAWRPRVRRVRLQVAIPSGSTGAHLRVRWEEILEPLGLGRAGLLGPAQNALWMCSQLGAKSGSDYASRLLCPGWLSSWEPPPSSRATFQGLPPGWLGPRGQERSPGPACTLFPGRGCSCCHQASGSLSQPLVVCAL